MGSKDLLTIFTGQRTQLRVVAKTYGEQKPSLLKSCDWTPNLSIVTLEEYDNLFPALIYSTYDDTTVKLGYPQNNQDKIEAVLANTDPTLDATFVDYANLTPFSAYANLRGLDGIVKGSYLLADITPSGNAWTGPVKEGAERTLDGKAIFGVLFNGVGIAYARFRGTTTAQALPAAAGLAQTASGGALSADTYYFVLTAITASGETPAGPEESIQVVSGSVNEITVTTPAITSPITGYKIYMGNRSGSWRYAATCSSGTTTTITTLPGASAVAPPTVNTTGVQTTSGDVAMTASGNVWTGTLPVTAYWMTQNSRPYCLIKKNGITIASCLRPANEDTFSFSSDGTTISFLSTTGATDWYDVFYLYKPNPA